jgi:hypothetical protein
MYFSILLKSISIFSLIQFACVLSQQEEDNVTSIIDTKTGLFTNYDALREEGQGFFLQEATLIYETPGSSLVPFVSLYWWCDLEFSADNSNNYGYVGRSVRFFLGSTLEDVLAQGAESPPSKKRAESISAVFVPALGLFEGQTHPTHDDNVNRFWDDGSSTLPYIGWEGHDEGDTNPNSDTSAWSFTGTLTKITTKEAATYLDMVEQYISIDESNLTPETCRKQYEEAWNATHQPDPIDTTMIKLEEEVAQLQADNEELMSRIASIEESIAASGGGDGDPTSTSLWYDNGMIEKIIEPIMILTAVAGFIICLIL